MSIIFLCPLAYDYIDPDKGTGIGTIIRIEAMLSSAKNIKDDCFIFVSTAGYTKESPDRPTNKVKTSLAEQIYKYLIKSGFLIEGYYTRPISFGTYAEIYNNIQEIESLTENIDCANIITSSHWIHIPRVWLCWKFLAPYKFKVKFIACHHPFGGPKEYLKEIVKFSVYLKRFVFKQWPS